MSPQRILITGGAGGLGRKLGRHFRAAGCDVRLLDIRPDPGEGVVPADLSDWTGGWQGQFEGCDAVLHFAGSGNPDSTWEEVRQSNVATTQNVFEAAALAGVGRVVFASSNWVMAGHRFSEGPITTDMPVRPINPYGASKWMGEEVGRTYADRHELTVVCLRIGYNQHTPGNHPGPHMGWGLWGQQMWLSDRDLLQGCQNATHLPAPGRRFEVVNLMSRCAGMRWDLDHTREVIGYVPQDEFAPVETDQMRGEAEAQRQDHLRLREIEERYRLWR